MAGSPNLLLSIIIFESVFTMIFGLFTVSTCSMGLTAGAITPPSVPDIGGIVGDIAGFFIGIAKFMVWVINGLIILAKLFTGLGMNCGFPTWYVSIIQIPLLITTVYLLIPFIKS
jgi:hypothetical protein